MIGVSAIFILSNVLLMTISLANSIPVVWSCIRLYASLLKPRRPQWKSETGHWKKSWPMNERTGLPIHLCFQGIAPGMTEIPGGVSLHLACHARAQNMGAKAAEMLKLMPGQNLDVIERCSGHGGSWGVKKENFDIAMKVGRPPSRQVARSDKAFLASECPLAALHLQQGAEAQSEPGASQPETLHPIELMARAYGLTDGEL